MRIKIFAADKVEVAARWKGTWRDTYFYHFKKCRFLQFKIILDHFCIQKNKDLTNGQTPPSLFVASEFEIS